jgi:hypothetical protein
MSIQQDAGSRRFTKRLVIANTSAAWSAIGLSIWLGGHETVVPAMSFLVTGLIGIYSGTGHLDYRSFLRGGGDREK